METVDMWAVGFFVAFFIPLIVSGPIVYAFYSLKRKRGGGSVYAVPLE